MAVQTRAQVTKGKAKNIDACADQRGIIRAAAMDQRGSLMREIGKQGGAGTPESLTEFKTAVTRALTPYATAILMDPEYGLPALRAKAPTAGVLLAYERFWIAFPTSVEPVNAILFTSGCDTSSAPVRPSPVTMFTTPGGSSACRTTSQKRSAVSGVVSAGLSTTVLPAASAGAIFHASMSSGKFHGMI